MKKVLKTLFFLPFMVCIAGCFENKNGQMLVLAEAYMETEPDSASAILEKMDNLDHLSDNQRAFFALLWTQAQHKCHRPLGNDSLINIATKFYTRNRENHLAAKALLYKGLVHRQRKEVEKAAEAFALSEQWFEGVEDDQYKALLYNYHGLLMYEEGNYKDALRYYKLKYRHLSDGDSLHYAASACGQIANVYKLLGQMDSARFYYKQGLAYKSVIPRQHYYMLLKGYANFAVKNGDYIQAEQMLKECEQQVSDKEQKYSIYSCFASLYYDTKDYAKALVYAERMQESQDSVMMRGCYFHLYRIHTRLGNETVAHGYYKKYTDIHDALLARRKTAEVAAMPHKVAVQILAVKNQDGKRVQWILMAWIGAISTIGGSAFYFFRKRNKQKVFDQNMEIGKLNSKLTRKGKKIEEMEKKQKNEMEKERDKVKEKNDEIQQLKENEAAIMRKKRELEKELETTLKKQQNLQEVADRAEHDRRIDQCIVCYRVAAKVEHIGALLMQLKHGKMYVSEQIPDEKFRPMIESLLDAERPGMRERIDASTNNLTKQLMCYLIALDLNDEDMMFRATGKKLDTVRKYHKECEALMAGSDWGEGSRW